MMPNECAQLSITICNHQYKMWCKKDKIEQAEMIIDRISPIVEKIITKHQGLTFDKALIMAMIDILSKDKDYKIDEQTQQPEQPQTKGEFEEEKQSLINDFIQILTGIKNELEK